MRENQEQDHDFEHLEIRPVADVFTDFTSKFGIPRQGILADKLTGKIVFRPEFRQPGIIRELDRFSHIWLIWGFSANRKDSWSPTVRPPRLGGNRRVGVFASRSPFRPNPLGLSVSRILRIEESTPEGPVIYVTGADLMNGTPVYDIKPYIPYGDSVPEAEEGYAAYHSIRRLEVNIPAAFLEKIPPDKRDGLEEALSLDPRPRYHHDPDRVYGFGFAGMDVRFRVEDESRVIVTEIVPTDPVTAKNK